MKPHVSVIIPTFNRRLMLLEAIRSVLAQRGARYELIVVDDGSTDATLDAARAMLAQAPATRGASRQADNGKGLCDVRLERTARCGVSAARNHGAALARAEFLAFLDSDDLWAPAKLSRQLDFMCSAPHFPITQTGEVWLRDGRRVNPSRRHGKRAGNIFLDSLRTCLISPSAVMVRRELFFAFGGFDRRMTACEDYDLWLRILTRHAVGLLDEPLVTRRAGHPDQLSATTPALDRFRVITLLKLLADPRLESERRVAAAEVLAEKCRILAAGLTRRTKVWPAEVYARAAALAETHWRWGDLCDLPQFANELSRCGLTACNFDGPPAHAPVGTCVETLPTLTSAQPDNLNLEHPAHDLGSAYWQPQIGTLRDASVPARM
jgi:glycosyltransferase involved in cell wall biosynthesis